MSTYFFSVFFEEKINSRKPKTRLYSQGDVLPEALKTRLYSQGDVLPEACIVIGIEFYFPECF
jgi:hypothetical protein